MGGEAAADGRAFPRAADVARKYRIAIVPGFFAECLEDDARPFAAAAVELRSRGFTVVYLPVTGRGSVATNAALLAEEIAALPDDPRPLLVFAYSKGLPDVLDFAVRHPEASRRIAAVIGMAGAVNGSPLADRYEDLWRATMMSLSIGKCAAGSGEGVHDLRRDVRMAWWNAHRAEIDLPISRSSPCPSRPGLRLAHGSPRPARGRRSA